MAFQSTRPVEAICDRAVSTNHANRSGVQNWTLAANHPPPSDRYVTLDIAIGEL